MSCLVQTSCSHRHALAVYEKAKKEKPYDAIVVPGIPFEGKNTSHLLKKRLLWAKYLYDSGFTKNIIFSGAAVYTPYVESIIMKTIADSLGIPSEKTFCETKAEHGTENVYYSSIMAKSLGFNKIALATGSTQANALGRFIRKYCPCMIIIPIVYEKIHPDEVSLPVIDPTIAKVENFKSLKQRESFFTRLRNSLGKRVRDEVKKNRK